MRGFITIQQPDGSIGDNGLPNFDTEEWSELIPCKYSVNEWDNKGSYNGEKFTKFAFEITLTKMDVDAKMIRLYDSDKVLVAEKVVISCLKLKSVQRVKIKI